MFSLSLFGVAQEWSWGSRNCSASSVMISTFGQFPNNFTSQLIWELLLICTQTLNSLFFSILHFDSTIDFSLCFWFIDWYASLTQLSFNFRLLNTEKKTDYVCWYVQCKLFLGTPFIWYFNFPLVFGRQRECSRSANKPRLVCNFKNKHSSVRKIRGRFPPFLLFFCC